MTMPPGPSEPAGRLIIGWKNCKGARLHFPLRFWHLNVPSSPFMSLLQVKGHSCRGSAIPPPALRALEQSGSWEGETLHTDESTPSRCSREAPLYLKRVALPLHHKEVASTSTEKVPSIFFPPESKFWNLIYYYWSFQGP